MTDLITMTDDEIEREIERLCEEQERRRVLHLRAMAKMQPFAFPARLYAGTR